VVTTHTNPADMVEIARLLLSRTFNKMLSYRRQTALQGALVLAEVEDWNWETIFYGHYRSIFKHWHIIGLQSYRIR